MHSEICPVCKGKGVLKHYGELEPKMSFTSAPAGRALKRYEVPCHGCNGRGWIEVQDTFPPYVPYVPYRLPWEPKPLPYDPYVPAPLTPWPQGSDWTSPEYTKNDCQADKIWKDVVWT